MTRGPGARGQAALELLALIPLVVLAVAAAWQIVAVAQAGLRADAGVRERLMRASGPGGMRVVTSEAPVASFMPGIRGLLVRQRAGVRLP